MTEQLSTQDIFKYIMAAPPAEPLTLSPVDLMLLREWLRNDALEIESLDIALASGIQAVADSVTLVNELRAELAGLRNEYVEVVDELAALEATNDN